VFDAQTLRLNGTIPAFVPSTSLSKDTWIDPTTKEIYISVYYSNPSPPYSDGSYLHILNPDGSYKQRVSLGFSVGYEGLNNVVTNSTHIFLLFQGGDNSVPTARIYSALKTNINKNSPLYVNTTTEIGSIALDSARGWLYYVDKKAWDIWRIHTVTGVREKFGNVPCPECDPRYDGPWRLRIFDDDLLCAFPELFVQKLLLLSFLTPGRVHFPNRYLSPCLPAETKLPPSILPQLILARNIVSCHQR
jgi:hypothetical protein